MEELVYVWGNNLAHCSREGLEELVLLFGDDYEVLTEEEYCETYPEGME
jgi:hypothetical protein